MMRKTYPGDLKDAEWEIIEPWLPPAKSSTSRGAKRKVDLREILNGIRYRQRTGCTWHLLPHDLPPHQTVYQYWHKWQRKGVLKHIHAHLREQVNLECIDIVRLDFPERFVSL